MATSVWLVHGGLFWTAVFRFAFDCKRRSSDPTFDGKLVRVAIEVKSHIYEGALVYISALQARVRMQDCAVATEMERAGKLGLQLQGHSIRC
jgi:hypothetical protein